MSSSVSTLFRANLRKYTRNCMQFKTRKLKGFNSDKHRPICLRLLVNILNISIRPSASDRQDQTRLCLTIGV